MMYLWFNEPLPENIPIIVGTVIMLFILASLIVLTFRHFKRLKNKNNG